MKNTLPMTIWMHEMSRYGRIDERYKASLNGNLDKAETYMNDTSHMAALVTANQLKDKLPTGEHLDELLESINTDIPADAKQIAEKYVLMQLDFYKSLINTGKQTIAEAAKTVFTRPDYEEMLTKIHEAKKKLHSKLSTDFPDIESRQAAYEINSKTAELLFNR